MGAVIHHAVHVPTQPYDVARCGQPAGPGDLTWESLVVTCVDCRQLLDQRITMVPSEDLSVATSPVSPVEDDIRTVLNRYSAEAPSGTPDFILARYLIDCLKALNEAVHARAQWRNEPIDPIPDPVQPPPWISLTCPDCGIGIGAVTLNSLGRIYRDHLVGSHIPGGSS